MRALQNQVVAKLEMTKSQMTTLEMSALQNVRTYVRTYVRACVRACVRTYVQLFALLIALPSLAANSFTRAAI